MEDVGYPVFKGLQKPLEFMGIRGKFIFFAAGTFMLSFLGFLGAYSLGGLLVGVIVLIAIAGTGLLIIFIKQKSGLHGKKSFKGIVHYTGMYSH